MRKIYLIIVALFLGAFIMVAGFLAVYIQEADSFKKVNGEAVLAIRRQSSVFKKVLEKKKGEISKYRKKNNFLSGRIANLTANNLILKKKLSSIKYNIKETEALKVKVQKLTSSLKRISGQWRKRLSLIRRKAAVLNKSRYALRRSILLKDRELSRVKAENKRLSSFVDSLKLSKSRDILAEEEFKSQIDKLKEDNLKIKTKLSLAHKDTEKILRSKDALERELSRIKSAKEASDKEIDELKKEIASLNNTIRQSKRDNLKAKADLDRAHKDTEKILRSKDALERELSRIKLAKEASDKEIDKLKKEIASLNNTIRQSKLAIADKIKELDKLTGANKRMKKELTAAKNLSKNIGQLKSALSAKDKYISSLKKQLGKIEGDNAQLKEALAKSKDKINNINAVLGERAERILTLQDKLNKQSKMLAEAKGKVNMYIKELSSVREKYVESGLENARLSRELADSNSRLLGFQNDIAQMMKINSQLRERIQNVSILFKQKPVKGTNGKVKVKLESVGAPQNK